MWNIADGPPIAVFCVFIVRGLLQMLGPVAFLKLNSKYYSGEAPRVQPRVLPSFTVVIPVYKESLKTVIAPTIASVKAAMMT
jgi:hypothetical protein